MTKKKTSTKKKTTKKTPTKKTKKKTVGQQASTRNAVFDTVGAKLHEEGGTNGPVTVKLAKELLGWEEEGKNDSFGSDYLVKNTSGKKVRCLNNVTNRYPSLSWIQTLKYEHLNRRWRLNGEPIIIGRTALILNGQHQLIALVLAGEEWRKHRDDWRHLWKEEPTMDKLIVYGIAEDDATVNTLDTARPRSLADVIYRSAYFSSLSTKERRISAKITSDAIKNLWHRTGADANAWAPKRTHAESLDFLSRHPKLLEAVRHIHEEDGSDRKIGYYIGAGAAAALLYLMGSATSERVTYIKADPPTETQLDWTMWEQACEFWVLLAQQHKDMVGCREAIKNMLRQDGGSYGERCAIIAKTWKCFLDGKPAHLEDLELAYSFKDDKRTLIETPIVGGIDVGSPDEAEDDEPTPEEIEEIEERKDAAKAPKPDQPSTPTRPRGKPRQLART